MLFLPFSKVLFAASTFILTIQSAIAAYENQMQQRFAEVGKQTMDNTKWMHSPDGLSIILAFFNEIKDQQDNQ